jgi:hypothetical protein
MSRDSTADATRAPGNYIKNSEVRFSSSSLPDDDMLSAYQTRLRHLGAGRVSC